MEKYTIWYMGENKEGKSMGESLWGENFLNWRDFINWEEATSCIQQIILISIGFDFDANFSQRKYRKFRCNITFILPFALHFAT